MSASICAGISPGQHNAVQQPSRRSCNRRSFAHLSMHLGLCPKGSVRPRRSPYAGCPAPDHSRLSVSRSFKDLFCLWWGLFQPHVLMLRLREEDKRRSTHDFYILSSCPQCSGHEPQDRRLQTSAASWVLGRDVSVVQILDKLLDTVWTSVGLPVAT